MISEDLEEAERLGRRRAWLWPLLAVGMVFQQWRFFTPKPPARPFGLSDYVDAGMWLLLVAVPMAALLTRGWAKQRALRDLMEDEATRANRARSLAVGFLCAIAAAAGLFIATIFVDLGARTVLNIVVSAGIGSAMLCFGILEWRDYAA